VPAALPHAPYAPSTPWQPCFRMPDMQIGVVHQADFTIALTRSRSASPTSMITRRPIWKR
jgi:hypothetical protein